MDVRKVIKYAVSLAGAGALLYFSFRGVDWNSFLDGFMQCRPGWIATAMLASMAAFFFRSERWKCLLRQVDPTIDSVTAFNCVNIGYLVNFVFPRLGEFVRCGFIQRRSAARHREDPQNTATFDKTLGTVLMSRSWDIAVVLVLFAALLGARWGKFGDFFIHRMWNPFFEGLDWEKWWIVAIAMAVVAIAAVALVAVSKKKRSAGRVRDFLKGIVDGFVSWAGMPRKWLFFVWTVLLWLMYWLMSYATIRSIPAMDSLAGVDALFVCIAGSFAWMVPVPGGFGAYHYIVALALSSVYALEWDLGLMCATLNHEAQAITMLLCGIISYICELIRK